jgi:hypothetical protein
MPMHNIELFFAYLRKMKEGFFIFLEKNRGGSCEWNILERRIALE